MSTEQEGIVAWNCHNQIVTNEIRRRELMLENMKLIHQIHNGKLYQVILGDEDAPWSAYLGQHETFYSASKIYTLDKIYGKFISELGLIGEQIVNIPTSKLANLIGVVTKENVEEWLDKAKELTTQDFEDELRKATGKVSYLDCPHKFKEYEICSSCGFRHRKEM